MKRHWLLLLLGALLAVAWWARPGSLDVGQLPPMAEVADAPAPPPPPAPTAAAVPPAAERAIAQDGAFWSASWFAPEALLEAADEDDPRAGVLHGRLTVRQQPWLHPAGVELRLTRSWLDSVIPTETSVEARVPARDEMRTTTDAQGRFAFRFVPPATELFFLIGHRTEWEDYQKVARLPHAGERLDLGELWLEQRGEITGTVAVRGRPVAGAIVRAIDDPLLDGASGFEDLARTRLEGLDAYQAPGSTVDGPLPDWVVRRDGYLPFPSATTDANGNFRLRGVRPGNHLVLAQREAKAGWRGRSDGVLVAPGRSTEIGTIAIANEPQLELRFVDEREQPWIGARVVALAERWGFGSEPVQTDANGAVLLPVPGSAWRLVFGMPNGGPWRTILSSTDPGEAQQLREGTITVPRPKELVVALEDSRRNPVVGGTVRTYARSQSFRPIDRELPGSMQPRESTPGQYVGQIACNLVVVATGPGLAPAIAEASPDQPQLVMTMVPLQTATVHVHDTRGAPIAGATVRVHVDRNPELRFVGAQWGALANNRVALGKTDDHGDLRISTWPAIFSFQATHRDYAPSPAAPVLPMPDQRIDVLLLRGAAVHGVLTIGARPAPAGLRVRAQQAPAENDVRNGSGYLDERLAVTGDGGTFAFRGLAAGAWQLRPELPKVPTPAPATASAKPWKSWTVRLLEGQELHTAIEIEEEAWALAHLTGVVTRNGVPVADALVRIRELDPPDLRQRNAQRREARRGGHDEWLRYLGPDEFAPWRRCDTDAWGEFTFRGLSPRTEYELRVDVRDGGRLQFLGRRVVRSGTDQLPTRVAFALRSADVRLSCQREGRPFANHMLRLRQIVDKDVEGARYELLLDANGEAWADQLPAGDWTVEPMHGGRCEPARIAVVGGNVAVHTIAVFDR